MSWFSEILGTDGVITGLKEGIDKAILTPEEKLDFHVNLLKSYEPFKLAQRYLALSVTAMFGFVLIIEVILTVLGTWFEVLRDTVDRINNLELVYILGVSFLAVMSLYFAGGFANSVISRFTRKM